MLKKNVLNILLMAILSISIVPTSLFSMEKTQKSNPTDQINEILHNLDQEQDEFIRSVLSTYRVIGFNETFEDRSEAKSRSYLLYKNKEKENSLEEASQYLNDTIQEGENNINNILGNSPLDDNEKAELVRKMAGVKERQIGINERLTRIKNSKNNGRSVLNAMYGLEMCINNRLDRTSKNFKINECGHYYNNDKDSLGLLRPKMTDMSRCPLCEWDREKFPDNSPIREPKVTEPSESNNPPNRFNNWLRSYIWPTTKITLYTSCLVLAVVLASRLFNLR